MTSAELIPATLLKRKAVVYVRQSTQSQVMTNLESQRRQYDLVDVARQRGFVDIEVIDDDLGRSASGTVARPGFDRLVAWLCAGKVGAVLCFDASRLARNGRDWHHLLELCGLVEARVIDLDGVYNPCRPNDRLLLGMKAASASSSWACSERGCSMPRGRRRAGASCAYRYRSATSGIAKQVWGSTLIYACRK
jgi:Resolvase, N terminal domain